MNPNIPLIVVSILYPFAVWVGTSHLEPRWVSLFLLAVLLIRLVSFKKSKILSLMILCGLLLVAAALWQNAALPLKLYPVLVNAAMLSLFSASLIFPPTIIERFARLKEPNLPAYAIHYTRRVTQVWCVFFIINGAIALYTSFYCSNEIWTLYNGLIAYLLIGLLFAIEYGVRIHVRKKHRAKSA